MDGHGYPRLEGVPVQGDGFNSTDSDTGHGNLATGRQASGIVEIRVQRVGLLRGFRRQTANLQCQKHERGQAGNHEQPNNDFYASLYHERLPESC